MPFEFSGAPPALLSTSSAFSTFASSSQSTSPRPANAPTYRTVPSLSKQSSAPIFGNGPAFGQAAKPTFGSTPTWPSSPLQLQHSSSPPPPTSSALTAAPEPDADDTLSRALVRASKGKTAAFGRNDIAADDILSNLFNANNEGQQKVQALLSGLREVEATSPAVSTFIRSLFDDYVRVQRLGEERPMGEIGSEREPSLDAASDATEFATVANTSFQSNTIDDLYVAGPNDIMIPRDNWLTKQVSARLATVLLNEGYIWYGEGARVLAEYMVDLCYELEIQAITENVVALLARQANDGAIEDVVLWTIDALETAASHYLHHPDAADPSGGADSVNDKAPPTDSQKALSQDSAPSQALVEQVPKTKLEDIPFRFLDLPAELRNCLYRELMAPGHIGFDMRPYPGLLMREMKSRIIRRTSCKTDILRTCRQIHHEAKDILYENTFCVTATAADGMLPVISQSILPDRALSRLTSLTLAFIAAKHHNSKADLEKLHWKQFQHMTGLKHLRICILEREDQVGETNEKRQVLEQIIERVPEDCHLTFESSEGFEDEFAQRVIDGLDSDKEKYPEMADAYEVDGELLSTLAGEFKSKQGSKSGSNRDFRFPDRGFNLKPLVAADKTDPSIVLGGCQ